MTLISCNYGKNGIIVEIKNSSNKTIQNITFLTDENTKLAFDKIMPNQAVEKFLDMTNNHKSDGAYVLLFERENEEKEQTVSGYYTNGVSLDKKVECEINNDTVFMKYSGIQY